MRFDVRHAGFPRHVATYVSGIALLAGINLLTSPGDWWVQWPALGWGIGLLSHSLRSMAGDRDEARTPPLALPDDEVIDGRTESDAMVERAEALLRREKSGR